MLACETGGTGDTGDTGYTGRAGGERIPSRAYKNGGHTP